MKRVLMVIGFCCCIFLISYEPGGAVTVVEQDNNHESVIYLAEFFPRSSRGSNSPFRKTRHQKRPLKIKKDQNLRDNPDYQKLLSEIRKILSFGEYEAYKRIKNFDVLTNWQIGDQIKENAADSKGNKEYEKLVIRNLSFDLGIDKRKLYRILKFHELFQNISEVSQELSWQHYIVLIAMEDKGKRNFYQQMVIDNAWDPGVLKKQAKKELYESRLKEDQE